MKILGLEIENHRIRFAELEESWTGKLEVVSLGEVPADPEERRGSPLKALLLRADQVVVSLPGQFISSRVITLPFTQPKKIDQVLRYEVEPLFPFDPEKTLLDYQILSRNNASTLLMVAAVLKEEFRRFMEKLHSLGIDPHRVEWDGMALFNFSQGMSLPDNDPLLLVHLGGHRSSLCLVKENRPMLLRSIAGGAEDFPGKGDWDEKGPFFTELFKTLQVFENEAGEPVRHMAVCGEGSRIGGVSEWLSEKLQVPLLEWNLDKIKLKKESSIWKADPLYVRAVGLALKATSLKERLSNINFRREEFAHSDVEKGKKGRQMTLVFSILLIFILGFLDLSVRFSIKKNQYEKISHQLQNEYRSLFPGAGTIINETDQTRGAISRLKKREAFLNLNEVTALEVLKEISLQIPKEMKIDVNELSIAPENIRLEAETDSFEALDKIKESLMKIQSFGELTVEDAKMNAQESRVRFKLSIVRSPAE